MAKGEAIRPEALAIGIAVAIGMYAWYQKVENYCVDFDELWKEEGPIHIKQGLQESAFEEAGLKLRSVDAAGQLAGYSRLKLALHVANKVAPKCDWEEISKTKDGRGKRVWDGFVSIADYTWDEMFKETT